MVSVRRCKAAFTVSGLAGEPRGCEKADTRRSSHSGSNDIQPFSMIASAATFGSGHLANFAASNSAARDVIGFRMRFRCSITASACSASRTAINRCRGVGEEAPLGAEGGLGLEGLGKGVWGETSGEERSPSESASVRVCPSDIVGRLRTAARSARFRAASASRLAALRASSASRSSCARTMSSSLAALTAATICSAVQPLASMASRTAGERLTLFSLRPVDNVLEFTLICGR